MTTENGKKLVGEIAVVTGSDSGIGQAIAIEFANEGADVAITWMHDREGAEKTRQAVEAAGRKAVVVQLDQRDPGQVERLFVETENRLGTPTILINNAAMEPSDKFVKDLSFEEWDTRLKSNLYGPFYCCRQFLNRLEGKNRHGSIINITSVHQEIPRPGASDYDVSKGGLKNLTTTLALEVAEKNINVNNLAPGMVKTPMNQDALDNPAVMEKEIQSCPLKRMAEPREIARAAVYLASEDARYVHGATLTIDGGLLLLQGKVA